MRRRLSKQGGLFDSAPKPRSEDLMYQYIWQALCMVSSWQVPAAVGTDLHDFGSWSVQDVSPFEAQVAYAFVKTRWETDLSKLSDNQIMGLYRACYGAKPLTDEREFLKKDIPAIWLKNEVSNLLLEMTLQLSIARAIPSFGLSPALSSPACQYTRLSFGLVVFEALLNLYAHALNEKSAVIEYSAFHEALRIVVAGELLRSVYTALSNLEGNEVDKHVLQDEQYVRDILAQHMHARLGELYATDEYKQRPRPLPERKPLVVEAEERGFRKGVKWWLDAKKNADGEAVSYFGFVHLTAPKLRLYEWESLSPQLPCFVADVDLREAVCREAAAFFEEKGYKTKVYYQLD